MKTALDQYLRAAEIQGLLYFIEETVTIQEISVRRILIAPEGAEPAFIDTDVRIVDVPVDYERYDFILMQSFPEGIRDASKIQEVAFFQKLQRFFFGYPFAHATSLTFL
jgi:hypothetical protein